MQALMRQSWRWYGPDDSVTLQHIQQAGATDVVTALHHIANGDVWPVAEIQQRQKEVRNAGLDWSVVESVPIHEEIKLRTGDYNQYIKNYISTLENLSSCGISTVCYNFMPVVDWTRTHLDQVMEDGSLALAYEHEAMAAFDLFILSRPSAAYEYRNEEKQAAESYFQSMTDEEVTALTKTLLAGLPGSEESYSLEDFRKKLDLYTNVSEADYRNNLYHFLQDIIPSAERFGVKMCIHPDDPPFPLFGLPRVVSTERDFEQLLEAAPSYHNGITFCTGSLGARHDLDLPQLFRRFAPQIHFVHFRNVQRNQQGFYESDHLTGSVAMDAMMWEFVAECNRRLSEDLPDCHIPVRPDHGHLMVDDMNKKTNPGYSTIGRLRGLAELRGLEKGIVYAFDR